MKSEQVFEKYAAKIQLAYDFPLIEARQVNPGDLIEVSTPIGLVQTKAEEKGWIAKFNSRSVFVNDADFKAATQPVTVTGTEVLPEGAKVVPVKKGDRITTQPFAGTTLGVESIANADGFLVTLPEDKKQHFLSDAFFRATYVTDIAPLEKTHEQGHFKYIPQPDDEPVRFVVLEEETVLDFKAGAYTAPAGFVLYENNEDEDGYTVVDSVKFSEKFTVKEAAIAPAPQPNAP